jgi:hypothetical protein
MNAAMDLETAAERVPERVCVVIWDGSTPEAQLRRYLDDALPLRFERWQDRTYLAAIEQLRPRVIVVVEPTDELAADAAGLLACLVTAYTPTIIAMTLAHGPSAAIEDLEGAISANPGEFFGAAPPSSPPSRRSPRPRLLVRQLGPSESAWIDSMADITFA